MRHVQLSNKSLKSGIQKQGDVHQIGNLQNFTHKKITTLEYL